MSLVNWLFQLGGSVLNLCIRIIYIPFALVSWLAILVQNWRLILTLGIGGFFFFGVGRYGGTIAAAGVNAMNIYIAPVYRDTIRPVLNGVIRNFFNPIVCWLDGFLMFPYLVGRDTIFPILRDGGIVRTTLSFAQFAARLAQDLFVNYFFSGRAFSQSFDYGPSFAAWQAFVVNWQALWCFGCNDACPIYTKTINFIVSDQIKDPAWGDFVGKTFNGVMQMVQQVIYIVREWLFPTSPTRPYLDFDPGFALLCDGQKALRISFENILQEFWDAFIAYRFVWRDVLCFFDTLTCVMLMSVNFVLNLIIHADGVISHFSNRDSAYWNGPLRSQYTAIINLYGPAAYFAPIPLYGSNITSYQLLTSSEAAPDGSVNPIFNKTTLGECFCLGLTRLICDPQANGTTCAQQYNGTLLADIDPCCWTTNAGELISNNMAYLFEWTLHFVTVNDFIDFLDKQPFTTDIKIATINTINCFWMLFKIVTIYGFCIEQILRQFTGFVVCSIELTMRIVVALLTVPYYNEFLPGQCNFITCPGDSALNMSLSFLYEISNPNNPDGFVNCMCYTLNTGFNVPFAGCGNLTTPILCQPTGFIPPSNVNTRFSRKNVAYPGSGWRIPAHQRRFDPSESFYNATSRTGAYAHRLTPIRTYGIQIPTNLNNVKLAFRDTFDAFDRRLEDFGKRAGRCNQGMDGRGGSCALASAKAQRTLIPLNMTTPQINCTDPSNPTPYPVPCFGLCCLPVKLITLASHVLASSARAINGAFQTRTLGGAGSTYWNGKACTDGMPCFQSDLTMTVVDLIAPVDCLCQFIKLVLPPQGFGDPCCAFTVLGELVSCFLQVVINVGNSVAGDAPEFTYIKDTNTTNGQSQFISDVDVVLELSLRLFDCICNFIRIIFAVAFSGLGLHKGFDPCCIFRVWFRAILEVVRLLVRLILTMSTLEEPSSQCYVYVNDVYNSRPLCPYSTAELGIVQQFRVITRVLFAPPKYNTVQNCTLNLEIASLADQDATGLTTCACKTVNAVLAMVYMVIGHQGNLNATPTCPVNLCCPIYSIGDVIFNALNFLAEATATFWQNWRFAVIPTTNIMVFIPQETLFFIFCDEYGPGIVYTYVDNTGLTVSIPNPAIYPGYANKGQSIINNFGFGNPNGTGGIINANLNNTWKNGTQVDPPLSQALIQSKKCGKLEPMLQSLENLVGKCLCIGGIEGNGVGNILDNLLAWLVSFVTNASSIFPFRFVWGNCLCNGGPLDANIRGMIIPAAKALVVAARQIILLIRNVANPTMWAPAGGTLTDPNYAVVMLTDNFADLRLTWINRFIAPFADAVCQLIVNSGCLLSMILGDTCLTPRYTFLGSLTRYFFEAIIRISSTVEGFVKLFAQEPPGLCVGSTKGSGFENPNAVTGNAIRPDDQGSTGDEQLVPTCSPSGNNLDFGDVRNGGTNTGQIGRILNSIFMFAFDALIGIARFGCQTICPTFNLTEEILMATRLNLSGQAILSQSSNRLCNCWNLSPYTGLTRGGGKICSFQRCDMILNSGLGTFSACGTSISSTLILAETCPLDQSRLPPNTLLPVNSQPWLNLSATLGNATVEGDCQLGCSNNPKIVNQTIDGTTFISASGVSWIQLQSGFPFTAVVDPNQPNSVVCKTNPTPTDPTVLQLLENNLGRNAFTVSNYTGPPTTRLECFKPVPNVFGSGSPTLFPNGTMGLPYKGGCSLLRLCGNGQTLENFYFGNVYLAQTGSLNFRNFYRSFCEKDKDGIFTTFNIRNGISPLTIFNGNGHTVPDSTNPPSFQRRLQIEEISNFTLNTFLSFTSVAQYLCETCLLVARSNSTYNNLASPTLQPICTRAQCLIQKGMCKNEQMVPCTPGGPILDGVIISLVKLLSCTLKKTFTDNAIGQVLSVFADVFDVIGKILGVVWQLSGGIVRLVTYIVVYSFSVLSSNLTQRGILYTIFVLPFELLGGLFNLLTLFFGIFSQPVVFEYRRADGTLDFNVCNDIPCYCNALSLNCNFSESIVFNLNVLKNHFGNGNTNCDVLIDHVIHLDPKNWSEVDFALKYELTECVVKRAHGDYFDTKISKPWFHADFFYNPNGLFSAVHDLISSTTKRVDILNPHLRKERAKKFKESFFTSSDSFARLINNRGRRLRKFYREEVSMSQNSIVLWPMMQIELFHYKFTTGYYHYMFDKITTESIIEGFGTPSENLNEVKEAFTDLITKTSYVISDAKDAVHGTFKRFPTPGMPLFLRSVFDGSLWGGVKTKFSDFERPRVRYNPPSVIFPVPNVLYEYTPTIARNVRAVKGVFYGALHTVVPQYTTRDVHERFIIGGDCRIVDGVVNQGTLIADYCLNEYQANIPVARDVLGSYLDRTSHLRRGSYHERFRGRFNYTTMGTGNWKRPKLMDGVVPLEKRVHVHRDVYRRATGSSSNPVINTIDNWFGIDIVQTFNGWIQDVIYWLNNPNLSDEFYPDVGARYWAQHMVVCKWPSSLNCSIGTGFGYAFTRVGLIFLIILAACILVFPGALSFWNLIFGWIVFWITVSVVAWHYSPACIALFPTSNLAGTPWTIPILPIPLNIFPALPMCIWDELINALDSVFATCYTWIPAALQNNQPCDGPISFPDCTDVGISTPLDVIVYFGYQIFGNGWCDFMIGLASSRFFDWIVPNFLSNTRATCTAIKNASETQMTRNLWCASLSAGTLLWVGLGTWAVVMLIVVVVPALLNVIHALILLTPLLPFYDALVGMGSPQGVFVMDEVELGEEEEEEEEPRVEAKFVPVRSSIVDYVARAFKRKFMPKSTEKME